MINAPVTSPFSDALDTFLTFLATLPDIEKVKPKTFVQVYRVVKDLPDHLLITADAAVTTTNGIQLVWSWCSAGSEEIATHTGETVILVQEAVVMWNTESFMTGSWAEGQPWLPNEVLRLMGNSTNIQSLEGDGN